MQGELKEFVYDILHSGKARKDSYIDYEKIINNFDKTGKFSRKIWGFLCVEIWQQQFHDQSQRFRSLLTSRDVSSAPQNTHEFC